MTKRCDAGTLELGAGLDTIVSVALQTMQPGDELDVVCYSRGSALELPAWARIAGHEVVDEHREGRHFVVRLRRGAVSRVLGDTVSGGHETPQLRSGFTTKELRRIVGEAPARAPHDGGLIPIGSIAEAGGATFGWPISERDQVWSTKLGGLSDRAARSQWDATRDIPWEAAQGLRPDVERAVSQVMTYIAQNEYAAFYVPSRYLASINPSYVELVMWLASHVHDEARHVEVFTKRALAGGYRGQALASTELSLQSLLDERDFSAAALLLNVLGEGTFLDLLSFIGAHAPDAATARAAQLAHRDERRHVQFGISHVRERLSGEPEVESTLVQAVEARAAKLVDLDGLSPIVGEALVVMTSKSLQPADVAEAGAAVRQLMGRMHRNRIRRLRAAGFSLRTASHLSELHTPNLM